MGVQGGVCARASVECSCVFFGGCSIKVGSPSCSTVRALARARVCVLSVWGGVLSRLADSTVCVRAHACDTEIIESCGMGFAMIHHRSVALSVAIVGWR